MWEPPQVKIWLYCCVVHFDSNLPSDLAAISTFVAINELRPDIVINAGTAGGFKRIGGNIGDSYIGTHFKHHDRRIPIPGFTAYGIGSHKSYLCKNLVETHNFKSGVVSTGNSLDHTEKVKMVMQLSHALAGLLYSAWLIVASHYCTLTLVFLPQDVEMMLANEASVKDMEAAAVAWAAELSQTPFLSLKVVTDLVDGGVLTQDEFLANLGTAAVVLQEKLRLVIDFVAGRALDEL